jgi:enoyl-CoA hydratase/carnithine racemase
MALVDELARGPRVAQGVIRNMVAQGYEASEAVQLNTERNEMARAAGGAEAAEGIAAFLEKRSPNFSG